MLRSDVLSMEDLRPGMKLTGTVRNVVDFGAFVDIGVKQDGLVHISEMADPRVRDPYETWSAWATCVEVTVIERGPRPGSRRAQFAGVSAGIRSGPTSDRDARGR